MNTRYIYLTIMSVMLLLGMSGCSNNLDPDLMPTVGDRTLTIDGHDGAFTMNFGAAPSTNEVKVESNTLWKVEVNCEGGWCSVDKVSGRGDESFSIVLRDNMLANRTCSVTVYMVDAEGNKLTNVQNSSIIITVNQDVSNVQLSPSSLQPFSPNPKAEERVKMTVKANLAWTLSVTYEGENPIEFVTITPESDNMQAAGNGSFTGNGEATFYLSVADNRTAVDRKAYLNLRAQGDVGSYSVEISQIKSEYTFDVSPTETQMIPADGGQIRYGVLSLSGWIVASADDWITFSRGSGEGNSQREETIATILPNTTGAERSGVIQFTPTNTNYKGLTVIVVQAPNETIAQPAVSIPWLVDGFGQTFATVMFNFYSPYAAIVEAGLDWKKENSDSWERMSTPIVNEHYGTVSFDLTGLNPATPYEVRGYVTTEDGFTNYGSVSIPFTTTGQYPGSGDNPTPSK